MIFIGGINMDAMSARGKIIILLFVLACNCAVLIFSVYELRTLTGGGAFVAKAVGCVATIVGAILPVICGT